MAPSTVGYGTHSVKKRLAVFNYECNEYGLFTSASTAVTSWHPSLWVKKMHFFKYMLQLFLSIGSSCVDFVVLVN